MDAMSDLTRVERELSDAIASDGLKEQNEACADAIKLTDALPQSAGGSSKDSTFFQTEKLLSYLSDERDLSGKAVKQNKRMGPKGDDAETRKLVHSILAERSGELRATSSEECCADLVGALVGEPLFEAKPWVGSSADSTTHMDEVQQTLFNAVRKRLPCLIAEKVRSKASKDGTVLRQPSSSSPAEGEYEQLARSLQERVATAMHLDAEDASCFVEVSKLEAKLKAYSAIARHLLDQNERLRRVASAEKLHASHLEDVASSLTVVHDRLASRLECCSTLLTSTSPSAVSAKAPPGTAAHAEDSTTTDLESAFDELCEERLRAAAASTEAVGKREDEQKEIEELAYDLVVELNEACQGSVKTWCMNQASLVKPDRVRAMKRELFREFHEDPERFLRRVRSAQEGACRDS